MTVTNFTPVEGLIGGLLIGFAVVLWLWLYGRVTGLSGVLGELVLDRRPGDRSWRLLYLVGLILGVLLYEQLAVAGVTAHHFTVDLQTRWPWLLAAGFLVGVGTRLGNGCTSGHGVCGLARLSGRSFVSVVTFMFTGAITVYVVRHLLGGD